MTHSLRYANAIHHHSFIHELPCTATCSTERDTTQHKQQLNSLSTADQVLTCPICMRGWGTVSLQSDKFIDTYAFIMHKKYPVFTSSMLAGIYNSELPTNPPTERTDQPTNSPTHQPTHRPTDPPTHRPTDPTHRPTDRPTDRPTNQPTS